MLAQAFPACLHYNEHDSEYIRGKLIYSAMKRVSYLQQPRNPAHYFKQNIGMLTYKVLLVFAAYENWSTATMVFGGKCLTKLLE